MADPPREIDWAESYYEALEFFYWEPQHIGRQRRRNTRLEGLKEVRRHLHRLETTLNHNLLQFFSLAPPSLRNELFEHAFDRSFTRDFRQYGDEVDVEFSLESSTQPDLLFTSNAEVAAIEMKIGAKCSVRQVLKYALLGLAAELHAGETREHYLILLGKGDFARQWREPFAAADKLKLAIADEDLGAFLSTQATRYREHEQRFGEIVANLEIAFIDYERLAAFLRDAMPPDTDQTPGAEVYRRLVRGMTGELEKRGLVVQPNGQARGGRR